VSTNKRLRKVNVHKGNSTKEDNNFIKTSNKFSPLASLCAKLDDLSAFQSKHDSSPLILTAHKNNILKMADSPATDLNSLSKQLVCQDIVNDGACIKCCEYESQLRNMSEELESTKKIIHILRDELNLLEQQNAAGNIAANPHNLKNHEDDIHKGMNWKDSTNKRKKCGLETNREKMGGKCTYSRKLIETNNRFTILETCNESTTELSETHKNRQKRGLRKRLAQKPKRLWSTSTSNPTQIAPENGSNGTLVSDFTHIPILINGQASTSTTICNQNILIIGDSHVRGMAREVQDKLTTSSSTSGFTSPGAPIHNIISAMSSTIQHLNKSDILVLWGGANDIYHNKIHDALKCIACFLEEVNNTNVIILSIPLRHDLPTWSCVNNGIRAFNRMLTKIVKPHKHASVVKVDLGRQCYTTQGHHLNHVGKGQIASCLAKEITNITNLLGTKGKLFAMPGSVDPGNISCGTMEKDSTNQHAVTPLTQVEKKATPDVIQQDSIVINKNACGQQQFLESQKVICVKIGDSDWNVPGQEQVHHLTSDDLKEVDALPPLSEAAEADHLTNSDTIASTTTAPSGERPRVSKRKKKPPTTKNEDFLW
jgi:hypothetical protein